MEEEDARRTTEVKLESSWRSRKWALLIQSQGWPVEPSK